MSNSAAGMNSSIKLALGMAQIYDPWNNPPPINKRHFKRRKPKIPKGPKIKNGVLNQEFVENPQIE